jgi:hypothetical protein
MRLLYRVGFGHHAFALPERAVVIDRPVAVPEFQDDLDRGVHHVARLGEIEPALLHLRRIKAEADAELIAPAGQVIARIGFDRDLKRMVIGEGADGGTKLDLFRDTRRFADDQFGWGLMLANPGFRKTELVGGFDLENIVIPSVAEGPLRPPAIGK